ncbi:helix-turn-helix domain-containing protein [Soonwooa sp.]|uniref:helix-turn-helix domain-containing protein n=1 Tax=Soonwooa sp. TaxID=1938592 RepID=UPI002627A1F7|nr:helix-turn-helix domain-containing protein [Soonwooa sp.]
MNNSIAVLHLDLFNHLDPETEFYCNTLQNHLKESHKHIERPHRHDFFMALLVTKGSGFHDIDFNTYEVSEGSLFFMSPGQVHSWQLSQDIEGYIFFFSQSFFDLYFADLKAKDFPFFGSIGFSRKLQISDKDFPLMKSYFVSIWQENLEAKMLKNHMIRSLISSVLISASRLFLEQENTESEQVSPSYLHSFQDFEKCLETYFLENKSVNFYAEKLNISPKHLNRISQSVVGVKASEIIARRTILEAKRMLVYLDESLVDIAFRLGFNEYPYFARFFKKQTGYTPSEFLSLQQKHQI